LILEEVQKKLFDMEGARGLNVLSGRLTLLARIVIRCKRKEALLNMWQTREDINLTEVARAVSPLVHVMTTLLNADSNMAMNKAYLRSILPTN